MHVPHEAQFGTITTDPEIIDKHTNYKYILSYDTAGNLKFPSNEGLFLQIWNHWHLSNTSQSLITSAMLYMQEFEHKMHKLPKIQLFKQEVYSQDSRSCDLRTLTKNESSGSHF